MALPSNTLLAWKLRKAVRCAMEGAGTLPAKEAVKLVPKDWHAVIDLADAAASRIGELETELEEYRRLMGQGAR